MGPRRQPAPADHSCEYGSANPLNDFVLAQSDIITFHCYEKPGALRWTIAALKKQGRPLICTEWLQPQRRFHSRRLPPGLRRNRRRLPQLGAS